MTCLSDKQLGGGGKPGKPLKLGAAKIWRAWVPDRVLRSRQMPAYSESNVSGKGQNMATRRGMKAACFMVLALGCGLASDAKATVPFVTAKMPFTRLRPAKISPHLCLLKYEVSSRSPECRAHFAQALGYFYSYVWMEAARSFETATLYDPNCALAWWGLSRALERWGKNNHRQALERAGKLRSHASLKEQMLILSRLQEQGLAPGVGDSEQRKKAAAKTLDELLSLYDDDEEGWYARAQLAGGAGLFGGEVSSVPYYKALLRVNPLHPGANHELVHFYEKAQRPALGWLYAENYIRSSPGLPHAYHMQAHLATRLGRWDKTSDRSAQAIELEQAYHKEMGVKPSEDHQYSHHLEILTLSLIHDGRFREAEAIQGEAMKSGINLWKTRFRLYLAERKWNDALKMAEHFRKSDKLTASYFAALVYLKQGKTSQATPEVEVLRQAYQEAKEDSALTYRVWEAHGMLLCGTGSPDAGLKLLAKAADKSKNDYSHHSWGNGAYYMEAWGTEALHAGRNQIAEEAFLEALAHDPGSFRAALGLEILCGRLGRPNEASRYRLLAERSWQKADKEHFAAEASFLRQTNATVSAQPVH